MRRYSETRSKPQTHGEDLEALDRLVAPLIKKGQPLTHIYSAHRDQIPVSERTLYNNLAIKAILDAIVPFVCVDDAAIYCDNLYLCQPASSPFAELYILPKSNMAEWIQAHQELDFCRGFS